MEEAYVCDKVLQQYEDGLEFEINPEAGYVSNGSWWSVGFCKRVGRDHIVLELRKRSEDFGSGVPQFVKPFVQDAALAGSLLRLHRKLERDADSLNIENDLADVFTHLSERHVSEPRNDSAIRDERNKILRVKNYLHRNYCKNISIQDLTEIAQLSRFHLMRTFRRDVGLPPCLFDTDSG